MSFLKGLKKIEAKPIVKQEVRIVKQTKSIVRQKQESLNINPKVKSLSDIPNVNIMTSGNLIGIRLRADKKEMLKNLMNYIENLIKK
ncbi:hypothetical protein LCGC14_2639890 [marine sediment metagenome]|uniref:Uncharacterized protein n=1 Tax=marine sediment metagenome TaxID=412755 RepID=A0A0F8ZXQ2_9ZZZZ